MPGNTGIEALDKATGQAMEGGVERETQAGGRHREGGGIDLLTGWERQILNETFIEFINGCCHWDWPLEATRE